MLKDRLKELRKRENITQIQFAEIFDISSGTIAMWETGKREPDINMLIKISSHFNCTIDYLVGISNKNHTIEKRFSENEKKLLENFKQLNEEGQYILLSQAEALTLSGQYIKNNSPKLDNPQKQA